MEKSYVCLRLGKFEHKDMLMFLYLTFSQDAGDENPSQGGDIGEICIAPRGGVKVALQ